jgi:predicted TPR repeat methyltransferase
MNIEKAYNSWAMQYDTNENKTRDLDIKSTIKTLSHYEFKNVLELGCGTGKNTEWLIKKTERIIGLDFSQKMLNIAQKKIASEKVVFKRAELTKEWPVENENFDLLTSSLTLEHIENLSHIFSEAYKKLVAEGLFFISELHPFKQYLGSKAKFETEDGVNELEVYMHHISEYIQEAEINGFQMIELKEWFDENSKNEIPGLISFVFKKKNN